MKLLPIHFFCALAILPAHAREQASHSQQNNPFQPISVDQNAISKGPITPNAHHKNKMAHPEWVQEYLPNGIPLEAALCFDRSLNPTKYAHVGAPTISGFLIYGKPGTGKTELARAFAQEAKTPFVYVSGSDFKAHLHGLGKEKIKEVFAKVRISALIDKAQKLEDEQKNPHPLFRNIDMDSLVGNYLEGHNAAHDLVEKARDVVAQSGECASALLFIDEIDAIARARTDKDSGSLEQLNELLVQMDGFFRDPLCNVLVSGATNMVENLDPALLRPGRFDIVMEMPLPDLQGRKDIIRLYLKKNQTILTTDDQESLIEDLASKTNQFSGADLKKLVGDAALYAGYNNQDTVTYDNFMYALKMIRVKKAQDKPKDPTPGR